MKRIFLWIAGSMFASMTWSGCGEDSFSQVVDVEIPDHTPALAIRCELTEGDTLVECLISHSLKIDDPSPYTLIENATVRLFRDESLLTEMQFDTFERKYVATLGVPLIVEGTFRLEVSAPGYPFAFAEQQSPDIVPVDELFFEEDGAILADGDRGHRIEVKWTDPADQVNFYSLEIFAQDSGSDVRLPRYTESLDPTIEYGPNGETLIDDVSFNGMSYTARLAMDNYYDQFLSPGGRLYAVLTHLTRDAYLYARSRELYFLAQDNPFAEPVVVHSNIEGGYGIFSVRRMSEGFVEF